MLKLNDNYYGNFVGLPFVMGSSDSCKYYPVISRYNREYVGNDAGIIYNKPTHDIQERLSKPNKSTFSDFLDGYEGVRRVIYNRTATEEVIVKVGKGYIADDTDRILFMLTNNSLNDIFYSRYSNEQSDVYKTFIQENLILFVSPELISNRKYSMLYKQLDADYIKSAYEQGIEVRFVTSEKIEKVCYSNSFGLKFNTINELTEHLNTTVKQLLPSSFRNSDNVINPNLDTNNPILGQHVILDIDAIPEMSLELINDAINAASNSGTMIMGNGITISLDSATGMVMNSGSTTVLNASNSIGHHTYTTQLATTLDTDSTSYRLATDWIDDVLSAEDSPVRPVTIERVRTVDDYVLEDDTESSIPLAQIPLSARVVADDDRNYTLQEGEVESVSISEETVDIHIPHADYAELMRENPYFGEDGEEQDVLMNDSEVQF